MSIPMGLVYTMAVIGTITVLLVIVTIISHLLMHIANKKFRKRRSQKSEANQRNVLASSPRRP